MIPQALPIKTFDRQIMSKIQKSIFLSKAVGHLAGPYPFMKTKPKKDKKMPP